MNSYIIGKLLEEHGQPLVLSQKAQGVYDPSTGDFTEELTTDIIIKGYFYDYSTEEIDGTNVQSEDRKLILSVKDMSNDPITKPEEGQSITGEGDKVSIVKVRQITDRMTPLFYICQVRG